MTLSLVQWQIVLAKLAIPLYFLLALLLLQRRIYRRYQIFILFLLVEGVAQALTIFGASRVLSGIVFAYAQPALWCLYILMVLEMFRNIFRPFPGIARFSQWVVMLSLVLALGISFVTLGVDITSLGQQQSHIPLYMAVSRGVASAVVLHLIFVTAYLTWMPVALAPNLLRHSILFFVYFLVNAAVIFYFDSVGPEARDFVNLLLQLISASVLVAWMLILKPAGEVAPKLAVSPHAADIPSSLRQLEALNATLSRSLK